MDAPAPPIPRRLVAALFIAGALVRGLIVALPLEESIGRVLTDDAFYNLQVAEHFLAGDGPTFDGRHPTNGFHPLWMLVCCLPVQLRDPVAATRALLVIASLVDLLGAWILFRTLRLVSTPGFATAIAALWLLNPITVGLALNGLDTPLVFALTTLAIGALITEPSRSRPRRLRTAALFALAFLARVDVLILAVLLGGYRLLEWWRGKIALRTVAATAGILALTIVPYFTWNRWVYGLWTPASGLALGEHLRQASGIHPGADGTLIGWLGYFQHALGEFLPEYLSFFGGHALAAGIESTGIGRTVAVVAASLLGAAFAGLLIAAAIRSGLLRRGLPWQPSPALFVSLVPVAYFAAYLLRLGPKTRYILPALVSVWLLAGIAYRTWGDSARSRRIGLTLLGFASINIAWGWYAFIAVPDLHGWTRRSNLTRGLAVLEQSVPEDARVGAFNSGIYAFFSDRAIVNLDGLINNDAYFAIRDQRLVEFIVEDEIDYVLDLADQIQLYLSAFGGVPAEQFFERFEVVAEIPLEAPVLRAAHQRLLLLRVKR